MRVAMPAAIKCVHARPLLSSTGEDRDLVYQACGDAMSMMSGHAKGPK